MRSNTEGVNSQSVHRFLKSLHREKYIITQHIVYKTPHRHSRYPTKHQHRPPLNQYTKSVHGITHNVINNTGTPSHARAHPHTLPYDRQLEVKGIVTLLSSVSSHVPDVFCDNLDHDSLRHGDAEC